MTTAGKIDLALLARELNVGIEQVEATLTLLEDGNTIPFITRYRRERTGGLDEEQIQRIQQEANKLRLLAERQQTILRSIESQGKLTPELAAKIQSARTLKWLEEVYLPFKPRKQTLATTARQKGLEPFAKEILDADPAARDLQARAAAFLATPENPQGLATVEQVLEGVGHILAEMFSERIDLRARLRKSLHRDGAIVCTRVETPTAPVAAETSETSATDAATADEELPTEDDGAEEPAGEEQTSLESDHGADATAPGEPDSPSDPSAEAAVSEAEAPSAPVAADSSEHAQIESPAASQSAAEQEASSSSTSQEVTAAEETDVTVTARLAAAGAETDPQESASGDLPLSGGPLRTRLFPERPKSPLALAKETAKKRPSKKQLAKERKRRMLENAFKDYYHFREALSRLPPHRVLAINRGERAKVLRIKIEYDAPGLTADAIKLLVPPEHPHQEFLTAVARDAMQRLVLPSLERELRRELAEAAEQHAVEVFIRNLRKLLLQPPVRGKRVLAVDPGFRSGCKLAAIDAFGNLLEHSMIHLVGNEDLRRHARKTLADLIRRHQLTLVAIGNGAGCRSAEHIVAEVIADELRDQSVAYLIVNEAGASVYSTSQIGRDELPTCDPMMRSAISIGRRLQDPLSELVKINPANIGVGMYQHDMKAKHLRESLDMVVQSCVNFVGVELNTASPSLLGYVSGLNQLTARRIYEHRRACGPFRTREQLKEVAGIGDATFVQAAGFLRITGGDQPLDGTWIHPESYELATRLLERLQIPLSALNSGLRTKNLPPSAIPAPLSTDGQTGGTDGVSGELNAAEDEASRERPSGSFAAGLLPTEANVTTEDPPAGDVATVADGEPAGTDSGVVATAEAPPEASGDNPPGEEPSAQAAEVDRTNETSQPLGAEPTEPEPTAADEAESADWQRQLSEADAGQLAQELQVSEMTVRDLLAALARRGRDPRDDFSPPAFRTGIMKLEDLKPGMELQGTVLNVVDFGAFVDIGMSDSALIHISKLADQFIRDPQEVISVGDILRVWVISVDKERRRVSLTAIDPKADRRPREQREPRPRRGKGPRKPVGQGGGQPAGAPAAGAPAGGGRRGAGRQGGNTPIPVPQPQGGRDQRPPRQGGKKGPGKPGGNRQAGPPPKPKPVRPITQAMLTGKQPMRSFSDLMQFYEKKAPPTKPGDSP